MDGLGVTLGDGETDGVGVVVGEGFTLGLGAMVGLGFGLVVGFGASGRRYSSSEPTPRPRLRK